MLNKILYTTDDAGKEVYYRFGVFENYLLTATQLIESDMQFVYALGNEEIACLALLIPETLVPVFGPLCLQRGITTEFLQGTERTIKYWIPEFTLDLSSRITNLLN